MCIWNVSESDRHCQFCSFRGGCERYPYRLDAKSARELGEKCIEVMNRLVGEDIRGASRQREVLWGRNFVAYQLRLAGVSSPLTGKLIKRSHSTVLFAVKECRYAFSHPKMYERELELWKNFIKTIGYGENS